LRAAAPDYWRKDLPLLLLQFCYCCCTGTAYYGQENERNGCSFAFENSILLVQQGSCIQKFQLHNFLRL
jgi:hypothetical protein